MTKLHLIILILTTLSTLSVLAVDNIYRERSLAYNSYHVSEVFLKDINTSEALGIRASFLTESGKGTGKPVPEKWIAQTKDYMASVNKRSLINGTSAAMQDVPDEKSFQAEIEKLNTDKIKQNKETMKSFNKKSAPLMNEVLASKREFFEKNGMRDLYNDLAEHSDYGYSNPKMTREVMRKISLYEDIFLKSGDKELKALTENALKDAELLEKNRQTFEQQISERTKSFEELKSQVAKVEDSQKVLDQKFFTERGLAPVSSLSQLSSDERVLLLSHPSKPLDSKDPSKAINIINERRLAGQNFILKVKDLSNEVTAASIEGRAPQVSENLKLQAEKLTTISKRSKFADQYKTQVSSKLHRMNQLEELNTTNVSNPESKLRLLDYATNGSINPEHTGKKQKISVKDALNSIPKSDFLARQSLARFILENGSPEDQRSLKIHASDLVYHVQKDKAFKLKIQCRRPR